MRNITIKLYDGSEWKDIDVDSSVQIIETYQLEKAESPTTNKDNVSYNIALPKTVNNNRFFDFIYKGSKRFDSKKRVDCIILCNGFVIESGYIGLTSITKDRYNITFYGGLGDFFYNLSKKSDGTKLKLSDIIKFDFKINRDFVKDSWNKLNSTSYDSTVSSYLSFAPSYNSTPKSFSQNKVMVNQFDDSEHFIDSFTEDGKTYSTVSGFGIANLDSAVDEWAVRDLRSYNQRPVIRLSKLMDSILDYQKGYKINRGSWFRSDYYNKGYLVLPNMNEANSDHKTTVRSLADRSYKITKDTRTKAVLFNAIALTDVGYDTEFTVSLGIKLTLPEGYYTGMSGTIEAQYTEWEQTTIETYNIDEKNTLKFRLKLVDISNNVLATSQWYNIEDTNQHNINITLSAYSTRVIPVLEYDYSYTSKLFNRPSIAYNTRFVNGMYDSYTDVLTHRADNVDLSIDLGGSITISYTEGKRSNSTVTQDDLLNIDRTPAEILLGIIKAFGLLVIKDPIKKEISIIDRNEWLKDEEPVPLDGRIDESNEIELTPFIFNKAFHNINWQNVSTPYTKLYSEKYDKEYGIKTITTGYDFNVDTENILSSPFDNCITAKGVNTDYNTFISGGAIVPPFTVNGYEWELFGNNNTESAKKQQILPKNNVIRWSQKRGSDVFEKMDLNGVRLTLCFFNGMRTSKDFNNNTIGYYLTDDTDLMYALNNGEPMYLYDTALESESSIPQFSRYLTSGGNIYRSFDFERPEEIYSELSYSEDSVIYYQYWKNWYESRINSQKLNAYCNLDGLGEINKEFLRSKFTYNGQLWMMNKCEIYKSEPSVAKIELIRI